MKRRIFRLALHFPVGLFIIWAFHVFPVAGIIFSAFFLAYELDEDWRIRDQAFYDLAGVLWGLAAGLGIAWLIGWL